MYTGNNIFFSPEDYIKFVNEEAPELIEKLDINTYSVFEGLIKTINDDISKNKFMDYDHYIKEFELDKVFPEDVLFKINYPELAKSLLNIKGTKGSFKFITNLFNITTEIAPFENLYEELDRNKDYNFCELTAKTYIDINRMNELGYVKLDNFIASGIDQVQDLAEKFLSVCLFIAHLLVILRITDRYEFEVTDNESDRVDDNKIDTYHILRYNDKNLNYNEWILYSNGYITEDENEEIIKNNNEDDVLFSQNHLEDSYVKGLYENVTNDDSYYVDNKLRLYENDYFRDDVLFTFDLYKIENINYNEGYTFGELINKDSDKQYYHKIAT